MRDRGARSESSVMSPLDRAAFEEGRRAYHSGMALDGVYLRMIADWDNANKQDADHRAIEAASKSFTLGYAQGALDDFRKIAGNTRGGLRA